MFSPIHEFYASTYRGRPIEQHIEEDGILKTTYRESSCRYFDIQPSKWNIAGKICFISIISGSCRFLLGALDVIIGLFKTIICQDKNSLVIFARGFRNCIKGALEAGPGIYLIMKIGKDLFNPITATIYLLGNLLIQNIFDSLFYSKKNLPTVDGGLLPHGYVNYPW